MKQNQTPATYNSIAEYHDAEVQPLADLLDQIDPKSLIASIKTTHDATVDLLQKQIDSLKENIALLNKTVGDLQSR